ncbi:MAG: cysteine--tRNA ligase, partial [Methylocella sp.]
TFEPRATDHIAEMIAMIEMLVAKGHAYVAEGHVLFDVPSMPAYGKLSRRPLDEMIAGARVEVAPYKRGPMDFVLWKPSNTDEPGWESPWGRGRPGWHIECSAMSWKTLGEVFDIHGGGIDLLFPHHENEMAQSCSAFGRDAMANFWMHNGHLQVEGEKMSKSLGNFVTIHELLHTDKFGGRSWPGEVLRLAILKTHYRQPVDFTVRALEEAEKRLLKWSDTLIDSNWSDGEFTSKRALSGRFVDALLDDLNTPLALGELHKMHDWARRFRRDNAHGDMLRFLQALNLAGIDLRKVPTIESDVDDTFVLSLVSARAAARAAKNWAKADRIRDELYAMGIALKDYKDGTTSWEVKR